MSRSVSRERSTIDERKKRSRASLGGHAAGPGRGAGKFSLLQDTRLKLPVASAG
jgi:hypothetical protein